MAMSSHWNFGLYTCTCVCRCVHSPQVPSIICLWQGLLWAWNVSKQARLASDLQGCTCSPPILTPLALKVCTIMSGCFCGFWNSNPVPMFTRHMIYNWASSTAHTTRTWRLFVSLSPIHPILTPKAFETQAWPYSMMMFCIALPPQTGANTQCPTVSLATQGDHTGHLLWLLDTLPSCVGWGGYISTTCIPNLPNWTTL